MQSTLNIARFREYARASIAIRNLEDDLKRRLRIRAAEHGRSMEEEAREILRHVVTEPTTPRNLAASRSATACSKASTPQRHWTEAPAEEKAEDDAVDDGGDAAAACGSSAPTG